MEFTVELSNCGVFVNEKDLVDEILGSTGKEENVFSDNEKLLTRFTVDAFCNKETREIELEVLRA